MISHDGSDIPGSELLFQAWRREFIETGMGNISNAVHSARAAWAASLDAPVVLELGSRLYPSVPTSNQRRHLGQLNHHFSKVFSMK
jgi:hypothetical protein